MSFLRRIARWRRLLNDSTLGQCVNNTRLGASLEVRSYCQLQELRYFWHEVSGSPHLFDSALPGGTHYSGKSPLFRKVEGLLEPRYVPSEKLNTYLRQQRY